MSVLAELKKPFNLISTLIAVLSLLLSVYFYLESLQRREPYYLQHQSVQIYSKTVLTPKITVIDNAGKPVTGDIHVLELSFWNNGKLSIEPPDIRTPIFIEFPEGYRLLESKVVKENKPAVTAFKLSDAQLSDTSPPRVKLEWAHLDSNLGARLQFIYVGEAKPKLKFKGDILDAEILDASGLLIRVANETVRAVVIIALFLISIIGVQFINIKGIPYRSELAATLWIIAIRMSPIGFLLFISWLLLVPKNTPI